MAWDQILHLIIGALATVILFAARVNGLAVFAIILSMALGKELVDHFFVLGHCYPKCMDEHATDFAYTLLFFFLYLPPLHFYLEHEKKYDTISQTRRYASIAAIFLMTSALNFFWYQQTHNNSDLPSCKVSQARGLHQH